MSTPKDNKQFKSLQNEWYKKLKDSGFEDIESKSSLSKTRKSFPIFENSDADVPSRFSAKRDYYIMAEHFLNSHTFESELEKQIWKLYSEGVGYQDTIKELKTQGCKGSYSRSSIHRVISKLVKVMRSDSNVG